MSASMQPSVSLAQKARGVLQIFRPELATAATFGPLALGLSLIIWLLGFLYNWRLKAAGLWGNLIVATSVGITFVLGLLAFLIGALVAA